MLRLALLILACAFAANAQQTQFPIRAIAQIAGGLLKPDGQPQMMVFGDVKFTQFTPQQPVQVALNISFFPNDATVNQLRGLHIHTFAISNLEQDPTIMCESTGPHWNPTGMNHGSPNSRVSHAGDLGSVQPVAGRLFTTIQSSTLQLSGPESIVGRSIVVHERPDDEGRGLNDMSLKNGNAGRRIACGTIGYMRV